MSDTVYPLRDSTLPRPNRFREITLKHLVNFIGNDYKSQNLLSALYEGRDDSESAVQLEVWSAPDLSKPTFSEAIQQQYQKISKGFKFGPTWSNHWVRVTLNVREEWRTKERVQFEFDPGCEAMIFTTEGLPLQGITGGTGDLRRVEFIIPESDRAYPLKIYIEVSVNGMFGLPIDRSSGIKDDVYFELASADIVVPRQEAWHLMWDFQVIQDIAKNFQTTNPICLKAQSVAMEISNSFDPQDLSTIGICRKIAEKILGEGWSSKNQFDPESDWNQSRASESVPILAIGHCHIDTAWLWPFSVTQQKIARSWSTQIDLMERYPEFRFIASTAQQYKWIEELYPQLFSKIRRQIEAGKFHVTGGSWVENDTNLPSGESLCRQFIHGQRYFKSRFGKYTDIYWLPDSFGYSSQLPQICRLSGMPYFFTQKFNKFPHSTFDWIGIDGTQILVHMTPVDTYNAQANMFDVMKAITNHKDLEWSDKSLVVYGNGDGGGGPLALMIESLRRVRAVANNSPSSGIPKVTVGPSVSDLYGLILKTTENGKKLPTWRGELYLEYHRGTYTSHGSIKRHNRKLEIMLRELEYYATIASVYNSDSDYDYPKDELDGLWEKVLLCQFHDVIPGSSIAKVYEDAEKIYAEVAEKGLSLLEKARQALIPQSHSIDSKLNSLSSDGGSFLALNTLSFPRQEIQKIPRNKHDGQSAFSHSEADGDQCFVIVKDTLGSGIAELEKLTTLEKDSKFATASMVKDSFGKVFYILANSFLTVKFSEQGRIDKACTNFNHVDFSRELILPGTTSGFVIYQDQPIDYDAWDVDVFHLDTKKIINAHTVKTTVSLDAIPSTTKADSLSMIRFDTVVEWHEKHKFLKYELPLDINSDQATYEIQYGTLNRPTHKNTSWERPSLRSSTYPDPKQDEGPHRFSFAILPHRGHFLESEVPRAAMAFNNSLHLRYKTAEDAGGNDKARMPSGWKASSKECLLDAVKRGEDDTFGFHSRRPIKTVVVRFTRHLVDQQFRLDNIIAGERGLCCRYIRERIKGLESNGNSLSSGLVTQKFSLRLKAFEILTIKFILE
ncbi:glycosyl hydrolases family 38 N-terminal domain-domain-containing protein [Phakopsora pachyrhizi]|uniref:Glycosyl hydrolases family 38 N-terminal domain-domain-containing protein n=1 Tax=Phakopsora pachyrhizi TaxID=170000 RepID=A0AAV0BBE6_PHAPC|nr:glycosyl hydrolases family 38 N-terminal domain-domain-containing protein [Phakopsora pachyrhizi]